MNIPVILYGDDGTLLHGIESQRGAVSVARTTDDLADRNRTGITMRGARHGPYCLYGRDPS